LATNRIRIKPQIDYPGLTAPAYRDILEIERAVNFNRGYVDRGDPAVWDAEIGAFTADSAYHANGLDLSSIIPANAVLALFLMAIQDGTVGQNFIIRKGGNSNGFNIGIVRTLLTGVTEYTQAFVPVNANRTFDYYITSGTDYVYLSVLGWFI
jgi:hypothetical protein